jgi:glycosyltransferase involved in cell wall biosynthesis
MSASVRVLQLADYGGPYSGSFVPMLRTLVADVRGKGWAGEVVLGTAARGRAWVAELEQGGVPVRFVTPRPRAAARAGLEPIVAEDDRPTILHTHFTGFDIPAVQIARRCPDTLVFWHVHMGASNSPSIVARNIVKFSTFGRRVDEILCVAPDGAQAVVRRGAPRNRVRFLLNAIDSERFPFVTEDRRAAARAMLGLDDAAHVMLHFGWDWLRKGGDLFLRAAKILLESGMHLAAVTVGGGEPARQLGSELGLGERLVTPEPRERVEELFAAADVFVSCSRAEGMTYAVAEALCSGTPVVASDIPGQAAIAPQHGARRLAPPEPAAIASAVRSLRDRGPGEAAADAVAARRWVVDHMNLPVWAADVVALYERALWRRGLV